MSKQHTYEIEPRNRRHGHFRMARGRRDPHLDRPQRSALNERNPMTLIDTTPTTPTVEVGTIFSSSWGYDQTNVSFYEVVKVTATGVRLRGIRKRIVSEDGYGSDGVVPIAGSFREDRPAFFRRLHVGRDYAGVNITSYEWASLWDGEPERQTSSGWGH